MSEQQKDILEILKPREKHWVGDGFYVSTLFSMHGNLNQHTSPFLLMDHASPKDFAPTEKRKGVGEHPHRGFETVTFAIKGEVEHRDSGGGGGVISTGGVQWMTAAKGVVHEEFHSSNFAKVGGSFEMIQLWVNLPAKDKMSQPRYQSMSKEDFPVFELSDTTEMKIVAGEYQGQKGPALTYTPISIFEIDSSEPDQYSLELKDGYNTLVMIVHGKGRVGEKKLDTGEIAVMKAEGTQVHLDVEAGSKVMVFHGEPIREPIAAWGPFVMNHKHDLIQAVEDFEAGKMGSLVKEAT